MSKKIIQGIKKRIDWLIMEIIHQYYWDGYTIAGFKKELEELKEKLDKLENKIK